MKPVKRSIKFKRRTLFLIPLVLGCFSLSPMAQSVSPPPGGGAIPAATASALHCSALVIGCLIFNQRASQTKQNF
jgi:hypothetical protein